jgi:hypothetical protein
MEPLPLGLGVNLRLLLVPWQRCGLTTMHLLEGPPDALPHVFKAASR